MNGIHVVCRRLEGGRRQKAGGRRGENQEGSPNRLAYVPRFLKSG
ncbi:hypothetical protein V0288_18075 [Pannus brasiliensis CCIBt3594]|uniref:Uncharacterized protein n=1 Tax=Pannus brasiliensis CCIBt3594 TaxID=1427578 RepID=A0AAW9QV60_9CHRO